MKPIEYKKGLTIWFTGFSGAGKTTIAKLTGEECNRRKIPFQLLDGDILREGINKGLGFSKDDRFIQIKQAVFITNLLNKHGVLVLASFITPYEEMRDYCRKCIQNYLEVYVKCSLEECIKRDVKGLYKKALAGEINNFTGISDPYEEPTKANLILNTEEERPKQSARKVIRLLEKIQAIPIPG